MVADACNPEDLDKFKASLSNLDPVSKNTKKGAGDVAQW